MEENQSVLIHEVLPKEIFLKILRLLNYETLCLARRTCIYWYKIIEQFDLVKSAAGMSSFTSYA